MKAIKVLYDIFKFLFSGPAETVEKPVKPESVDRGHPFSCKYLEDK